ncbi:ABC transporter substrate-binding protein [Rhodococcus erythropolis]
MSVKSKLAVSLGTVVALGPLLTGCGSSSDSTETSKLVSTYDCSNPNSDTVTDISITAMPILSNGAIYAAIDQGFFAKQGLDVTVKPVPSIAGTISAVQGGSTDFAFTATLNLLQAVDNGISLVAVAPFAGIAPDYYNKMQAGEKGYTSEVTALLTKNNSGINTPGDLNGKTVAIMDAKGQAELTTSAVIKLHGGDPAQVQFVTMSPADAYNALLAGKVDAAYSVVPAFDGYEEKNLKIISWPGVEALHEGPTSMIVSSKKYVEENPDVAARLNCAMRDASAFANANPNVIREVTAREQKTDPASLASATVPYFYAQTDLSGIERFEKLMLEFGFLKKDIDPASLIIPAALTNGN